LVAIIDAWPSQVDTITSLAQRAVKREASKRKLEEAREARDLAVLSQKEVTSEAKDLVESMEASCALLRCEKAVAPCTTPVISGATSL